MASETSPSCVLVSENLFSPVLNICLLLFSLWFCADETKRKNIPANIAIIIIVVIPLPGNLYWFPKVLQSSGVPVICNILQLGDIVSLLHSY